MALPQATLPGLPQATLPGLPQATLPGLPQATLPGLPEELLWKIAIDNHNTFYAMATAIRSIGLYSLKPHVQKKLKTQFTIITETNDDNGITIKYTLPNGALHRDGGQAALISKRKSEGQFDGRTEKEWYMNGNLHRDGDEPASIFHYAHDNVYLMTWAKYGQTHRDGDKPAFVESQDGICKYQVWYMYDKKHRDEDLPAIINGYEDSPIDRVWYKNGLLHRDDGPARIFLGGSEYWKNGVRV